MLVSSDLNAECLYGLHRRKSSGCRQAIEEQVERLTYPLAPRLPRPLRGTGAAGLRASRRKARAAPAQRPRAEGAQFPFRNCALNERQEQVEIAAFRNACTRSRRRGCRSAAARNSSPAFRNCISASSPRSKYARKRARTLLRTRKRLRRRLQIGGEKLVEQGVQQGIFIGKVVIQNPTPGTRPAAMSCHARLREPLTVENA